MTSQRPLFPPEPPLKIGDYEIRQGEHPKTWKLFRGKECVWIGETKEAAIEYAKYRAGITQA